MPHQKLAPNFRFWGKMGSKYKILFSRPPKGTSLRETTSFDVLIVKIGAGVWRKNQKKLAESLNRIVMKFCIGVGVPDVITRASFSDDWFSGFWVSGGRIFHFSIDVRCRPFISHSTLNCSTDLSHHALASLRHHFTVSWFYLAE